MTRLLDEAIESVRALPESAQDVAACFLLGFSDQNAQHYRLTDSQLAEVEQAKREVRAGRIATDEEMIEVWRRVGP